MTNISHRHLAGIHVWYLFGLLLCSPCLSVVAADSPVLIGTVQRVIDGDTVDVQLDSGLIRVRLNAIDAPEKSQPWGKESTDYLTQRITGKRVEVEPAGQDRYERMIGVLLLGGANINSEMVAQGHAWAFRKYMKKSDAELCTTEHEARQAKRGLWSATRPAPVAPWEYRKRKSLGSVTSYARETAVSCVATIGK